VVMLAFTTVIAHAFPASDRRWRRAQNRHPSTIEPLERDASANEGVD